MKMNINSPKPGRKENLLDASIKLSKPVLWTVFMFAFVVNLLNVITPIYSLQVLDRVLGSQNLYTLLYLTLIILVAYTALHLMQVARSFTQIKLGEWMDSKLASTLFRNSIESAANKASMGSSQVLRDLETVKGFLTSAGINTLFDAPWSVVYIAVLFYIHYWMGWLALFGACVILVFAIVNAYATNSKLAEANTVSIKYLNQADIAARNAEVVQAMGMMDALEKDWHKNKTISLEHQSVASARNAIVSNISKYIRAILQMLVTALGAYIVVTRSLEMTPGGMIASSIMLGRALAPFDQAIEVWKMTSQSMQSYKRLKFAFSRMSDREETIALPKPSGRISVENVFFSPESSNPNQTPNVPPKYTLKGVSFALDPGDTLAIIGPSAAGKSTLAKLIVGIWKPAQGVVRLDGADVYTWSRSEFGKYVGYLPQDVELFSGTIKANIARMKGDYKDESVIMAAQMSGAHEFILRLPDGYETDIGIGGASLSGGQRQRVGLSRVFYENPKLIVLDEPNASLDEVGEKALMEAVGNAKAQKATTIIISHRPAILSAVDKILILQDGAVAAFGTREEILSRFGKASVGTNEA